MLRLPTAQAHAEASLESAIRPPGKATAPTHAKLTSMASESPNLMQTMEPTTLASTWTRIMRIQSPRDLPIYLLQWAHSTAPIIGLATSVLVHTDPPWAIRVYPPS